MPFSNASSIVSNGASGTTITLTRTGVPAGATLMLVAFARRNTTNTGDVVSSVASSPSATWAGAVVLSRVPDDNGSGRFTGGLWIADNVSSGDYTVTVTLTSGSIVDAQLAVFTGLTTSALDRTASNSVTQSATTISVGPTSAISQPDEIVVTAVGGKWWWSINPDGGGDFNGVPAGFTLIGGQPSNTTIPFAWGYKTVSASGSTQSASHAVVDGQGDGGIALIATLKILGGTLKARIKFKTGSGINGVSGLTAKVWVGDSDSNYSVTRTGLTAEASGDLLYCDPPPGAVNGGSGQAAVYKSGYASEYGPCTFVNI
jgi:hypothetical protein